MQKKSLILLKLIIILILIPSIKVSAQVVDNGVLNTIDVPRSPYAPNDSSYEASLFIGSFSYTYPLFNPQGRNSLTPSLHLSYDSGGAAGTASFLGLGWELTESYVERNTEYTPENLTDDTFRLVMNGQSFDLVWDPLTNRYKTQHDTFMNIQKLSGAAHVHGDYWEVTTLDGTVYRFGNRGDSMLNCSTRSFTSQWHLDLVTDTSGNHIVYSYAQSPHPQDLGAIYPLKIEYNNDLSRKINFVYESTNRPDMPTQFNRGCRTRYSRRLATINVEVEDQLVRSYDFAYTTNGLSNKSLLQSITESDGAGNSLPPTTFNYYPEIAGWDTPPGFWLNNGPKLEDPEVTMGDADGDGHIDIITEFSDVWRVYKNTKNESWEATGEVWLNPSSPEITDPQVILLDATGDGRPEIVTRLNGQGWRVYENQGTQWSSSHTTWLDPGPDLNDDRVTFADVNGDGRVDIVQEQDKDWKVFLNSGNSWVYDGEWLQNTTFSLDSEVNVTDVNGDGLADIVHRENGSNEDWEVFINEGDEWDDTVNIWYNSGPELEDDRTGMGDINGDGLIDIVEERDDDWKVYPNTGSSWGAPVIWLENGPDLNQPDIMLADADGNGTLDLINREGDWFVYLSNSYNTELLSTISTSLGGTISIDYTPSTKFDNRRGDAIPDLTSPMYLVTQVIEDNGAPGSHNVVKTTNYHYKGGYYEHNTPLFRGFQEVTESDPDTGLKIKHYFHQDKARLGREYKTEVRDLAGNLLQVVENTFTYATTNAIHDTVLEQVDSYTYDGNTTNPKQTTVMYEYDQYNQVTKASYLGDVSVVGDERYETTEYVYNSTDWILDKPKRTRLLASDETTILKENWLFYDGNNSDLNAAPSLGLLTKQESWLNNGPNPIMLFEHDAFGNVTKETDANGNETQYVFGTVETTSTYPDQVINAKGQVTSYTYDLATGNVLSVTDPNGYVTSTEYDGFGRVVKEIRPYDSSALPTMSYEYTLDGSFPEVVKTSQRTTSGQTTTLDSYTIMDGFGRVLQTKAPAEDSNQQIVTNTFYDQFGRVKEQSVPYFGATSTTYSTPLAGAKGSKITYDDLGREILYTNPDNTSRSVAYDRWKISYVDENSNLLEHYLDAYSQIVEIKEYNYGELYSTTYDYNEANELLSITDDSGNVISWIYDSLGRQIEMNDPNIGQMLYAYDGVGNLTSETDNRGITTITTYDELNRVLTIDYPSQTDTTYVYDTSTIGTITSITDAAGTATYSYDERLRQIQEVRMMDGLSWTTETAFDAADRVVEITYPSSEVVDFGYNDQGQIEKVGDFVTDYDYDATNRITLKSFFNGIVTTFTYALDHFRLIAINTLGLQELAYEYDDVGNITEISDVLANTTETYTYDELNRLISASELGAYHELYEYDPVGNITKVTTQESVLDYLYGENTGPHAVSSLIDTEVGYVPESVTITESQIMTATDKPTTTQYGHRVAISGNTLVIGSRLDDDNGTEAGSAYVYERNGQTGLWELVKKLTPNDAAAGDQFGWAVNIEADTIVVSAIYNDDGAEDSGSVYVFERDAGGSENWGEVAKLNASDPEALDVIGYSVDISGDTVIVAGYKGDDFGSSSGSAYIFQKDHGGPNNWGQVKKLIPSDPAAHDWFGIWVAIDVDTVVVGSVFDDDQGSDSGSAYVFERDSGGANNWGQVKKIAPDNGAAGDEFGRTVDIEGDLVVVSARLTDDPQIGEKVGTTYIFGRNAGGENQWGQIKAIRPVDVAAGDQFGYAVSLSGRRLVVDSRFHDQNGTDSGAVYVFEQHKGGANNWQQTFKLLPSDGEGGALFGTAVSIDEDNVVVGAFKATVGSTALGGKAYIYSEIETQGQMADDWTFNNGGGYVAGSNSQIEVTGTGTDWSAQFWRKDGSTFGSGNRVSFEFYVDQKDSKTHLSIVKDGGDLERFALIDSNGGLNVSIYRPAEAVPNVTQPLLNSTEFQANTWYSASITVDDQYGSFITVEQRDDPSVSATYRDTDGLLSTGSLWSFYGIMYQHTVFLDNYLEEAVTLTPPPADDWIFRNDSGSYVPGSQSQIQVNGAGSNWSAQFLRKDESTFGSGNRVSFEFYVDQKDSKTHLSILKDGGTVERFALVDSGGGLNVSIYRPAETVPSFTQELLSSTEFQANTWYSASITIDDQYGSFITVEQRDDPSVSGSFRDTDGLLSIGSQWSFFGIMFQNSVFLDNYLEEAVTLTPPPADDWIFRNDSGAYVPGSETQIQVNGTGSNWSAQFLRKDGSTFGSGNRVSFEFYVDQKDSKTHLSILKDGGNVERFALVDSGGGLNVSIYRPAETVPNFTQQLLDATEFQANTWYSASITVDDQYGSFITVEQRDDPSVSGSFRDTDGLLATGSQWSFFGIMYQYSVFLDNYLEEAVTLTPPPADDWTFRNDSGGYVPGSETQIQVNGTGSNWSAQFLRKPKSTFGTGNQVSFDFYVDQKDSKVHLSLVKDGGSYERFALVDSGGGLNANIYRPGEAVPNFTQQLLNATEFQANTWYSATITLDDVNGSQIEVEQRDDPTVNGSFQDTAGLLSTGNQWSFFGILFQHSVFLDNYAEGAVLP